MVETNGNKVKIAVLSTDVKYIKESQDALARAVTEGFKEVKEDLKGIKSAQKANQDEILVAKSSIKAMKGLIMAIGAVITFAITVFAAIR